MSGVTEHGPIDTMKITKVKEHIGAIVTGIDLAEPIDTATLRRSSTTLPSITWFLLYAGRNICLPLSCKQPPKCSAN